MASATRTSVAATYVDGGESAGRRRLSRNKKQQRRWSERPPAASAMRTSVAATYVDGGESVRAPVAEEQSDPV